MLIADMLHFCTYFDRNYLSRGLALYASLRRHCRPFTLWVLCLDDETRLTLERLQLPGLTLVPLAQLESCDPELYATKASRPTVEYYYTCGPALLLHLFHTEPTISLLTYLDADLFFFNDPAPALKELEEASVGLVSHRMGNTRTTALSGEFNVGWVSFRPDADGLNALAWWRARCLESCSEEHPESGICGDQKYLEALLIRVRRVVVLQHDGANLGFWNYGRFRYRRVSGTVYVERQPLLWFHFGDFRLRWGCWLSANYAGGVMFPSHLVRRWVLAPYARILHQLDRALAPGGAIARRTGVLLTPRLEAPERVPRAGGMTQWLLRRIRWMRRMGNQVFLPVRLHGTLEPEVAIILAEMARTMTPDPV